jgi:hypothetical protein
MKVAGSVLHTLEDELTRVVAFVADPGWWERD